MEPKVSLATHTARERYREARRYYRYSSLATRTPALYWPVPGSNRVPGRLTAARLPDSRVCLAAGAMAAVRPRLRPVRVRGTTRRPCVGRCAVGRLGQRSHVRGTLVLPVG